MKLKSLISMILGFAFYISIHYYIMGYGNMVAHPSLNSALVDFIEELMNAEAPEDIYFVLSDKSYNHLRGPGITNYGYFESTTGETTLDLCPKDWIKHGGMSADEPEVPAAVRHFYDPLGLRNGNKYLTNRGTYWEGLYSNPGINAIEWALGDTPKGEDNKWSFEKGKENFIKAIEEKDENKKNEFMAKAWRCLGETLHNTADMACPPHVRNDSHAAPFGWTGGWAMGSPDPYEEMFNSAWVTKYAGGEPDPDLKAAIMDATKARKVNELLASFTNSNFFSHETISGTGVALYKSTNGEKDYPSPKLENLEYEPENFTFYKTFASGRRIKMCKDQSYFRFRGQPYIDRACAESQASELIPNFKWAALKVFALFVPDMYLMIENIDDKGNITGIVGHRDNEEYENSISYNGKVNVFIGSKLVKLDCENGKFEGKLEESDAKSGKPITANVNVGGVVYVSPEYKAFDFSAYKKFLLSTSFEVFNDKDETRSFEFDFSNSSSDPTVQWTANKFIYNKTKNTEYLDDSKTLTVIMKINGDGAESIKYESVENNKSTSQGYSLIDKTEVMLEFKSKSDYDMYFNKLMGMISLNDLEMKTNLSSFIIKNTKSVPVYDNDGKIIKVNTVITTYPKFNHNYTWGTFTVVLSK